LHAPMIQRYRRNSAKKPEPQLQTLKNQGD
jgi:hypothetical protein